MPTNFVPRRTIGRPAEHSRLKSLTDNTSPLRQWRNGGDAQSQIDALTQQVSQLRQQVGYLLAVRQSASIMHPFKIYQNPDVFPANPSASASWRTFRVRGGSLFVDVASGTFLDEDDGTDGIDQPRGEVFRFLANETPVDQTAITNIVAPDNDTTYVWIEIDPAAVPVTGLIKWHIDPTMNGWASWPSFDCKHILIGWIDCESLTDQSVAIVRQVLTEDVCVF